MRQSDGNDGNGATVPLLPEKGSGPSVDPGLRELQRLHLIRVGGCPGGPVSSWAFGPQWGLVGRCPGQGLMGLQGVRWIGLLSQATAGCRAHNNGRIQ